MWGNSNLHFHSNSQNRPGSKCVCVEARRWRQGWLAWADADLDVPSALVGKAVYVCDVPSLPRLNWACWHSRQFLTAMAHTREGYNMTPSKYSNSQRNSLKKTSRRENVSTGRSWERQKQRNGVRPWQGQHSGQLWQHRSLFPAPPILPRSECVGALLNQIHSAAPVTNDSASVGMCWAGRKIHSFVTLNNIWSNNSSLVWNWHTL